MDEYKSGVCFTKREVCTGVATHKLRYECDLSYLNKL
jgi:hypothetical protein